MPPAESSHSSTPAPLSGRAPGAADPATLSSAPPLPAARSRRPKSPGEALLPGNWPLWAQYVVSICAVGTALLFRWFLEPVLGLGESADYVVVLCALMPLSVIVRPGPFIVAAIVGFVAALYIFVPPELSFAIGPPRSQLETLLFGAATVMCILSALLARRARIRVREYFEASAEQERQRAVYLESVVAERDRVAAELDQYRRHLEELVAERTRELNEAGARLRHGERMAAVGTLAAGLGHDLANAVLPLRVHTESLTASPGLSGDDRESVQAITHVVGYLASLSRGLRMLMRDPDRAGEVQTTDLAQWVPDVQAFLGALLPKGIALVCRAEPGVPRAALDPTRLTQAVMNLVHNARDAIVQGRGARAGGRIEIEARRAGAEGKVGDGRGEMGEARRGDAGSVVIAVRDDGVGMTPEVLARCRERYFTTKAGGGAAGAGANRGTGGGTGLGLSIVVGMVEGAGGKVEIESAVGRGTVVSLMLPGVVSAPAARGALGVSFPAGRAPVGRS